MLLTRAHGLGNDYLILESGEALEPALVRAICDRHRGVGGDGILEPAERGPGDHGVRIWNPDGSVAEKSGNGLRIFARWLGDLGATGSFTVWTGSELARCTLLADGVAVEMGRARFLPAQVPVDRERLDAPLCLGDVTLPFTAVGLGNPHAVHFTEAPLDSLPWRRWGAEVEVHPAFPHRTNVQFARVEGEGLELRIWERGAGETLASGSSSCAAAAAAVRTGRLPPGPITVHMPGGSLLVAVSEALDLTLTGPVEVVGQVRVDPRWLAAR
ncbi:MAG: diaminopimelate epimerase [Deltaproteobacteria bacterium]|nr:diaminopimelate epimerase [Deltaproteobacteria bacterium]